MLKYNQSETQPPQLIEHTAFCPMPYQKMIINAWGSISLCCHHGSGQIGNIKTCKNLLEAWNSPLAQEVRKVTDTGSLHKICQDAPNCPFHVATKWKLPVTFPVHENMKYPLNLEIDLPDRWCNIGGENPSDDNPACIMCIRNHQFPKNQPDLTELICEKARELMPYIKVFSVLGVAEPFWKNITFDIFDKVNYSQFKENIIFETNHNVTCFGEKTQIRFLEEVCYSKLQFSIDAASKITYRKIRRLDAYDLVINNIKLWMKNKNPNHKVIIWNNINVINVHEMTQMVEVAHDLRVDQIIMLPTHNQNNRVDLGEMLICRKNIDIFIEESERAMIRAKELGVDLQYGTPFNALPNEPKVDLVQLSINR